MRFRDILYEYRWCPTCRREQSAKHSSCLVCTRWLGDQPLERIERQIVPCGQPSTPDSFQLIGASAIVIRVVDEHLVQDALEAITSALSGMLASNSHLSICPIPQHGWLLWTTDGLRRAFLQGLEIEQCLTLAFQQIAPASQGMHAFRWGIWIDQYVVPFGKDGTPAISDLTACAIFDFEPDNSLLCSETLYEANCPWEHFVCVPRRLLNREETFAYRFHSHKRPSALDHAEAADFGQFVGRHEELDYLDACYRRSRSKSLRLAVFASAGSGKSRLVREWRRRHPELRILAASFSIFGGGLISFATQLAQLPEKIATESVIGSILARIAAEHIDALVLDDLHWADAKSAAFVEDLLEVLPSRGLLVFLISRPSGRAVTERLKPAAELDLKPLPLPVTMDLASRLITLPSVVAIAAQRSKGNPLFVEQFAAWAMESNYKGSDEAPQNLFQVISARIAHLSKVRLVNIQQRARWGLSLERKSIEQDLDRLEAEIGLWLDRLETGDYGDRLEASRHLANLKPVEFELFFARILVGKPQARSSRLREAIDRLTVGSADQILADLRSRAATETTAGKANVQQEALMAADVLARHYRWRLAADFYELALGLAEPGEGGRLAGRLADCRRRIPGALAEAPAASDHADIEKRPAVDALRLPEVWIELARRYGSTEYFRRATETARIIDDQALAEWAAQQSARTADIKD